ncbi:hypothetical protein DYBT9623_03308 [Dyadobacter sp. CECT 9623]|jgi:hypothetical protein|uniref:Uncharacterized protein n=1 Tax=Dyadobacter linearis TaxID=2823330 RepID=A0ABM8USS3_9BACT|nr:MULTISPECIES: hypothetical protein [unclassified Dyadobacter]MCE7061428.1 hypothetical protein [Dyadobacter sp. CY343]CAG5070987.1 hypothetical protein DYBT9623_03308 [Dyadobacter sp. CECT 9623]
MDAKKFTGREGQLISAEQALEIINPHLDRERDILGRGDNFVKAEFFGLHTFKDLISLYEESCVGFRVYYGVRDEEDNSIDEKFVASRRNEIKPTPRLVIVPVDARGNDLTKTARLGGMKDMAAEKEAMVGGPVCPRHC